MLEFIVSKVATLLTIGMFSSGIHTVQQIRKKGTGNISVIPFGALAAGTYLWLNYGILNSDSNLVFVNFLGFVLNCTYILLYYWYAPSKTVVYKTVGVLLLGLAFCHVYSSWQYNVYHTTDFLGMVGNIVTIASFASPLIQLRLVVETKNSESMSFPLAVMMLAQCIMWWWYGYLKSDFYIQFPNFCGSFLGLTQVVVILKYSSDEPRSLNDVMESV